MQPIFSIYSAPDWANTQIAFEKLGEELKNLKTTDDLSKKPGVAALLTTERTVSDPSKRAAAAQETLKTNLETCKRVAISVNTMFKQMAAITTLMKGCQAQNITDVDQKIEGKSIRESLVDSKGKITEIANNLARTALLQAQQSKNKAYIYRNYLQLIVDADTIEKLDSLIAASKPENQLSLKIEERMIPINLLLNSVLPSAVATDLGLASSSTVDASISTASPVSTVATGLRPTSSSTVDASSSIASPISTVATDLGLASSSTVDASISTASPVSTVVPVSLSSPTARNSSVSSVTPVTPVRLQERIAKATAKILFYGFSMSSFTFVATYLTGSSLLSFEGAIIIGIPLLLILATSMRRRRHEI